ncbi:hypothetical protein C0993_000153 [Termitomyces sp. T159_Od127]|nr:hypothetical protein C0993_000153 [Termitomyces sp. T159_Od127]
MVGADSRHRGRQNSQPLGRTEFPVPKPNLFASEAILPFPTSSSIPVGDVQRTVNLNAVFQSHGLSQASQNNGMFSASHATQHTREYINQSSDTGNPNSVYALLSKDALQDLLRSIEDMNRPKLPGQPQAPLPPEQLRENLLPVLLKSAQRRLDFNDNILTKVEVGLREALTDQFCDTLTRNLLTIKQEIQATGGSKTTATVFNRPLSLATVTGPDELNPNTSVSTISHMTPPTVVFRIMNRLILIIHVLRHLIIVTIGAPLTILNHVRRIPRPPVGVVIHSRPLILSPPAHVDRSRSPRARKPSFHNRRSPEHAIQRNTPVHMRSIDRTRPLHSPHRRDSTSDRQGLIIRNSPEPLSTVDNLSRRHPSSPSPRKRSRSSDSASYIHRLLPSSPTRIHESPIPLTVQGMATVKREPDVEDFTVNLHPSTNPSPVVIPSPDASGSPRPGSVSPSDLPPASLSQVPMESTHPPPARASPGPQSPTGRNFTIQLPGHPPDLPEECRNQHPLSVERGAKTRSSPVSSPPVLPEVLHIQPPPQQQSSTLSSLSILSQPCQPPSSPPMAAQRFNVPGLWFAKHGKDQADILDYEFEVNPEIMHKWLSGSSTPEATLERLSLQLLCIPVELLQSTLQISSVHELMDLGALTGSLTSMKTVWPEQGSLLVQMNPTKDNKRSWFPDDMGPTSPSLDITGSVHEGKNVLRLIQLEDMTNRIFMLRALLLPPTSQQDTETYWDIADLNLADHLATHNLSPAIVEVI